MNLSNKTKISVKGFVKRDSTKYYAILVDYKYWICIDNGFMRLSTKKSLCKKFDNAQDAKDLANNLKRDISECARANELSKPVFDAIISIPIV